MDDSDDPLISEEIGIQIKSEEKKSETKDNQGELIERKEDFEEKHKKKSSREILSSENDYQKSIQEDSKEK